MPLQESNITFTRKYLGDSVYVSLMPGSGGIKLYTNNGAGDDQVIYLDTDVIEELKRYLNDVTVKLPPQE